MQITFKKQVEPKIKARANENSGIWEYENFEEGL